MVIDWLNRIIFFCLNRIHLPVEVRITQYQPYVHCQCDGWPSTELLGSAQLCAWLSGHQRIDQFQMFWPRRSKHRLWCVAISQWQWRTALWRYKCCEVWSGFARLQFLSFWQFCFVSWAIRWEKHPLVLTKKKIVASIADHKRFFSPKGKVSSFFCRSTSWLAAELFSVNVF